MPDTDSTNALSSGRASEEAEARLAGAMMRKQLALGVRVAAVFLLLLLGLPLFNAVLPNLANAQAGGFTLTWLLLGVLFYPLTWLLSAYFIRESDRIEAEIVAEHKGRN